MKRFRERGFEPWPKKYLKYILMEWYIFLNEGQRLPGTWDCPLPSCDERNGTFAHVMIHLEVCQHLKTDTTQYTCPGCREDVEMPAHTCPGCQTSAQAPAMGHGKKAMLKIRRSLDNILGQSSLRARPSSAGSSPISPPPPYAGHSPRELVQPTSCAGPSQKKEMAQELSCAGCYQEEELMQESSCASPYQEKEMVQPISYAGPSQEKELVQPILYSAVNTNCNARTPDSFIQHNRNVLVDPINTQCNPTPIEEPSTNQSCRSSTATNSSFGSGTYPRYSIFSDTRASSATSSYQFAWSPSDLSSIEPSCLDGPIMSPWVDNTQPSCNVQHFGALPFGSMLPELQEHAFLQDTTNMEGMIFPMDSHAHINYSDVEKQFRGEFTGFPQDQWSQQDDLSSFMSDIPSNSPQEYCAALQLTSDANLAHDPSSPASTDATMVDTPTTSAGSSPSTSDSPLLECEICHWRPDMGGKRTDKKLRLAVEKHVKRNHQSRDYQCIVCNQSFRNRPDNVKPHVARKHPGMLEKLYPKTAQQSGGHQYEKARASAKPAAKRRMSLPLLSSQASSARGRPARLQRG